MDRGGRVSPGLCGDVEQEGEECLPRGGGDDAVGTRCHRPANSGTVLGAVALLTGSTVGAGILALPETVAPAGIGPSSAVLVACWGLLVCEALLLAEVNVAIMRERDEYRLVHGRGHSPVTISLTEMAGRTLGEVGATCTTATYLFLSMTLLVAYIAKAGEIISSGLPGEVAPELAAAAFVAGMGALMTVGGVKLADKMNQVLTLLLLWLFGLLVVGGAAQVDWPAVDWAGDWTAAPGTVPVVFLALVYHDLLPVICSYLAGDMKKINRAIVVGSGIPLLMFLSWDAVALGMAGGAAGQGGDPLSALMGSGGDAVALIVGGFSFCAIVTSFIGSAIGMSEFVQPRLENWAGESGLLPRLNAAVRSNDSTTSTSSALTSRYRLLCRGATYVSIMALPAAVALTNPGIFLPAANFAGAYGMTTMFGILPPVMALSMRAQVAELERVVAEGGRRRGSEGAAVGEGAVRVERQGGIGEWLSRLELGWLNVPTPRMIAQGLPGGKPALAALSFSAFAITLGQLRMDLQAVVGGSTGEGSGSATEVDFVSSVTSGVDEKMMGSFMPDEAISATAALAAAAGADAWDAATRLFQ